MKLLEKEAPRRIELHGTCIAPGIAVGSAYVLKQIELDAVERNRFPVENTAVECNRIDTAIKKSKLQLNGLVSVSRETGQNDIGDVFAAHLLILEDPGTLGRLRDRVQTEKVNAEYVLAQEIREIERRFAGISNEMLRKRFADVQDVYFRLLRNLLEIEHVRANPLRRIESPVILVAERLIPSDIPLLDRQKLLAIIMEKGDETSHVAIISRSLRIPVISGVPGISSLVHTGVSLIVDSDRGVVIIEPPPEERERYANERAARSEHRAVTAAEVKVTPCCTRDNARIYLLANVNSAVEAEQARDAGAEGIGLLRSEFFYMGRTTMPTLDEEFEYLRTIQEIFKGREITVRALDMGADKELPYFGLLHEDNPQLGCRGIRVLLMQRELFKKQVRSIARVSRFGPVRLLLPFIALPEDVDAAREVIDDACRQEGVSRAELPVGMMVEIPSAAVAMEHFVEGMDFFSIGTNDLLQYSFAAGRENNDLEQYKKLMHPIMLKIVHGVVQCAQQYHRSVSLCGEIQSVYNAGLMAGLGLPSLSLAPKMIKPVREYLSKQYMRDFSVAARRAINCRKRREVEMIVSEMTKI